MNVETKFSCVLCGNNLNSKEDLQEHFRKHANRKIDGKGNPRANVECIETKNSIEKLHKILPQSSEKVTCDVCPSEFETVTQAIRHKFRKHPESSAKHYCPYCGMQFPLKFTKDKHLTTHQGETNFGEFPCSECGVIFHNTQAQNYHFKSTHKRIMSIFKPVPTPPPSKKIKINNANEAQSVYYCYLCGMEYIIKFNLQKHLEASHNEEERNQVPENLIKCTTCDALFYNKKAYENHNMYHKPDDLYVSSEKQRLQTVTRVDQDYDFRRVQTVTDKFIPIDKPKRRRRQDNKTVGKSKKMLKNMKSESDEELSPTSSIDSSDSESEEVSQFTKETEIVETVAGNSKETVKTIVSITNNDLLSNNSKNYVKGSASEVYLDKVHKDDYRKRKRTKRNMSLPTVTTKITLHNSEDYKIRFADSLPTAMQLKSLPTAVQLGKFTDTQFVKRKIHRQK